MVWANRSTIANRCIVSALAEPLSRRLELCPARKFESVSSHLSCASVAKISQSLQILTQGSFKHVQVRSVIGFAGFDSCDELKVC